MRSSTGESVGVNEIPLPLLLTLAMAGGGLLLGVLYWMLPPPVRDWRRSALLLAMVIAWSGVNRDSRIALLITALGGVFGTLPMLWMGKIPADMPSAKDPRIGLHPRYGEIRRRGLIAGLSFCVIQLLVIVVVAVVSRKT